jgi:hypothetical protein
MRDGIKDIATQQVTELENLLGVTTRAEPTPLTAERE